MGEGEEVGGRGEGGGGRGESLPGAVAIGTVHVGVQREQPIHLLCDHLWREGDGEGDDSIWGDGQSVGSRAMCFVIHVNEQRRAGKSKVPRIDDQPRTGVE